jgi:hypothetical protein
MGKITINQESLKTSREYKRHKVEDGSNVYRILPPYGDVDTHNNYVFKRWAVAWLVNPETGKRTPFSSPITVNEKDCPVKEYVDALKDHLETLKGKMKAKGWTDKKIKEKLKGLYDVQWQIRVAYSYAYNACDKSGNVGILELKATAHQAMKKRIKEYITDYNQDPTSLNSDLRDDAGVWFNITREGEGKNTKYDVEFNSVKSKNKETGEVTMRVDRSPLPDSVVENYDDLGYDLFTLYRQKSYSELHEILLYNICLFAKDVPEAVLPGFEVEADTGADVEDEPPFEMDEEPVKSAKGNVNINFGEDDDDDEIVAAPVAKKNTAKKSSIDDIKSFADGILED